MTKKYHWLNHFLNFFGVILGVYLAFYFNEGAKQKQEQKERTILIRSMINELESDQKYFKDYSVPINQQYLSSLDTILFYLVQEDLSAVSKQFASVFNIDNASPSNATYNSIKSSGKIQLFGDINIQKAMEEYYDEIAMECELKNELQTEFFKDHLLDWTIGNVDLVDMKILDQANLFEFRNKLIIYKTFLSQKIGDYETVIEESQKLKEKLEAQLE